MTVTDSINFSSANGGVEEIELLCEQASFALCSGSAAEALSLLTQAFRLSFAGNQPALMGRVLIEMGQAYTSLAQLDRAADCYQTALKKDSTQNAEIMLSAYTGLARIYSQKGDPGQAIEHFTHAAQIAKANDLRASEALLLNEIGDLQSKNGYAKEALATYYRALEAGRCARSPEAEAASHLGAAGSSLILQNSESLALHVDQALLAMRRVQSRLTIRAMREKITELLRAIGESQQMIELELSLVDAYSTNQINAAMNIHIDMARVLADRGESDKGLAHLETARGFAQALFDRTAEARVVEALADIYEASGLSYMTLSVYEEWTRMARDAGDREIEISALESLSAAHERVGNLDNAIETLQRALLLAQSKCDRQLEAAYLFEQALLNLKIRKSEAAIDLLERAKRVLPEHLDPALASDIRRKLEDLKPQYGGGLSSRVVRK